MNKNQKSITLYHGGIQVIKPEDLYFPGPDEKYDFGPGFYLAMNKHTAEEWVKDKNNPVITRYTLEYYDEEVKILSGEDWLKVIIGFRREAYPVIVTNNIIAGDIANDRLFSTLDAFLSPQSIIGDLRVIEMLKYCNLGLQYCLKSHANNLKYISHYQLKGATLQQAQNRHYSRRVKMDSELRRISRLPLQNEKYVEDYINLYSGGITI